jgi:hypothetical protein
MPEPVTLVYEIPGACWMNIPNRRFNPFFALAEVVWILSGSGNVEWIAKYNKQMLEYNDGEEDNHGAYGKRIRHWPGNIDQIKHVVLKLKKDSCSRQAVISLWDPIRDNLVSKDIPCNNLVYYKLRDKVLDQTVVMRSNDLIWGTPYNAIQFSHLHALIAGELNVQMGTLTYVIENLHFYTDLYPSALGAVEEVAAFSGNTHALEVPGFMPVTDNIFRNWTLRDVELGIIADSTPDYWEGVIPTVVGLYSFIKELNPDNPKIVAIAGDLLYGLPEPLRSLAIDFYTPSRKESIQAVLKYEQALRRARESTRTSEISE